MFPPGTRASRSAQPSPEALVRDLIADFVSVLAVRLPMWLAEKGLTLGVATPLVISQISSLVAKWAARIGKLVGALVSSLRTLTPTLKRLGDLIDQLSDLLRCLTGWPPTPDRWRTRRTRRRMVSWTRGGGTADER